MQAGDAVRLLTTHEAQSIARDLDMFLLPSFEVRASIAFGHIGTTCSRGEEGGDQRFGMYKVNRWYVST